MATFSYKAKDKKGQLLEGSMEAESGGAVVSRLQSMGYFPVSVTSETTTRKGAERLISPLRRRIGSAEIMAFNRQLADLISAGVPLVKALNTIITQTTNPQFRQVIERINTDVQGGDTFAHALSKHPRLFSKLYCAMVKAGEAGGMLDAVLERLADFAETEESLKSKIKSAMAYPVVIIFASTIAMVVLMTVVVPKIVTIFDELNQTLPLPTQILINVNYFLVQYWWLVLAVMGLVGFAVWQVFKSEDGRTILHRLQLRVPKIGDVIKKREVARFARTLGSLLQNGVPVLTSLEITKGVLSNKIVAAEVEKVAQEVMQGTGLAMPLRDSRVFPPVVISMIGVGEQTGKLDEVLIKIAGSYEAEVDRLIKTLTSLIEPAIIFVMATIIGFIVISMLMPIFTLDPTIG